MLPKEARFCLHNLSADNIGRAASIPVQKEPLRERTFKVRVGLRALLLDRRLGWSDLQQVKVAIPSAEDFADCCLTDGLAEGVFEPFAEALLRELWIESVLLAESDFLVYAERDPLDG
jgi:hypothetical protein